MNENYCNEARGEQLIAYLYEDLDATDRAQMDAHLADCGACRKEVSAFRGLRRELGRWTLPEPSMGFTPGVAPAPARAAFWAKFTAVPVWAQAAAAMLVLGASAGLANLDVRYTDGGISIRTGWAPALRSTPPTTAAPPWQADLRALAVELRGELEASRVEAPPVAADAVDASRVQTLIAASERRQDRELALRLAELAREVQVQRRGDLEKIQYSLGIMESNLGAMQNIGVEVMRQRQIINGLAVPASQGR